MAGSVSRTGLKTSWLVLGKYDLVGPDGRSTKQAFMRSPTLNTTQGWKSNCYVALTLAWSFSQSGPNPFRINERFRATTRERQTHEFGEIQAILDELANTNLTTGLTARIGWLFPPGLKRPIITLPLMTFHSPAAPFSEISGIRLTKRTPEGLTTVTIDLRENRSLAVALAFPVPEPNFSASMLDEAVIRGTAIIEEFMAAQEPDVEGEER